MLNAQLVAECTGKKWAMHKPILADMLRAIRAGEPMPKEAVRRAPAAQNASGAVAVIPCMGVIMHRGSYFLDFFGGTAVENLRAMLRQALADDSVGSVVIEFDTPGGTVDGVNALAREIYSARGKKPIVAAVNTLMASAGYYLGSQCDFIMMSPSDGECGSIGVYAEHDDYSGMMEQAGVKVTFISAGEGKTDGNPYEPLADSAREEIQKSVNALYGDFVAAVARGRKAQRDTIRGAWQARVYNPSDAVSMGLADGIGTVEDAIAKAMDLKAGKKSGAAADPAASTLRAGRFAGVVPQDVSEETAPKDTPWEAPTLADFTDKAWGDLSLDEKRHIAGHYAWAAEMPPESFSDLKLPHHCASDGKIVYKGVVAALGRLNQSDIPSSDEPKVKAHLEKDEKKFADDSSSDASSAAFDVDVDLAEAELAIRERL